MQVVAQLFRECWGLKRPRPGLLCRRAQLLGYDHLQVHKIAGNWWLSLGAEPIIDWVMALSAGVPPTQRCLILAHHENTSVLIEWQQGQLQRIEPLSPAALTQHCTELAETDLLLEYNWPLPLPAGWQRAQSLLMDSTAAALVPLNQVKSLPQLGRRRLIVRLTLALLLLLAVTAALFGWLKSSAGLVPTAAAESSKAAVAAQTAQRFYLPPDRVLQRMLNVIVVPVSGAWQLRQVQLSGRVLQVQYQGQPPLAWLQLPAESAKATSQKPLLQQQLPLTQQRLMVTANHITENLPQLLLRFRQTPLPGLSAQLQGQQLQLRWQDWTGAQLQQLSERLQERTLDTVAASLQRSLLGWSGSLTVTQPALLQAPTKQQDSMP
ncbi:MAG: hypothetical protein ACQEQZ_04125 [Pseudomonadota bacterium]